MPGILINRLSRPKADETPEEQLRNAQLVLMEQMLPVICPNAREGEDYLYLADIQSRLKVHQEGEILNEAFQHMRSGKCSWIAVTEIARLSGDMMASAQLMQLCTDFRIPIFTREKLYHPFEPWRAASKRDLTVQLFVSGMEVLGYQERTERAREVAYPMQGNTGESRLRNVSKGLGRHINGAAPMGYVWNKLTKEVDLDQSIPFPEFIPPGATAPPAFRMWEIIKRLRDLGLRYGAQAAATIIFREAGLKLHPVTAHTIWINPFYAGRPTSRWKERGGKTLRRSAEEVVFTEGSYPLLCSWEEHLSLQQAIQERRLNSPKTLSSAWATGIVLCECGQPLISHSRRWYMCRGLARQEEYRCAQKRLDRGELASLHLRIEGWHRSPTCGTVPKEVIHEAVEAALRMAFGSPGLLEKLDILERYQHAKVVDLTSINRQETEILAEMAKLKKREENGEEMALDGDLSRERLRDLKAKIQVDREALQNRLNRLREAKAASHVPSANIQLLREVVTCEFDEIWYKEETPMSDQERSLIARSLITAIPMHGKRNHRRFGVVFPEWLGMKGG